MAKQNKGCCFKCFISTFLLLYQGSLLETTDGTDQDYVADHDSVTDKQTSDCKPQLIIPNQRLVGNQS